MNATLLLGVYIYLVLKPQCDPRLPSTSQGAPGGSGPNSPLLDQLLLLLLLLWHVLLLLLLEPPQFHSDEISAPCHWCIRPQALPEVSVGRAAL